MKPRTMIETTGEAFRISRKNYKKKATLLAIDEDFSLSLKRKGKLNPDQSSRQFMNFLEYSHTKEND